MAADWDTSGIHERRVDERIAPEPRRGWLGGRRRMAGMLTGLVSVAIIAGYIWSGSDRAEPDAGGEPPLIQADEGPIRVPPENPGGMEIPHRDKLVLQRVPGAEEDPRRERLLPPPEEPLPPPLEEPVATYEPPAESLPPPAPARESLEEPRTVAPARPGEPGGTGRAVPPSAAEQAPRPAAPLAQKPPAKIEPQAPTKTPAPPARSEASGGPRPLVPQAQQSASARPPGSGATGTYVWPSNGGRSSDPGKSAPPRTAETTTSYVLPPKAAQPAPSGSGSFLVQLAAVSTAEQAQAAWSRLRGNNGDLLAGLSPSYARTDLGPKGVVYRLRAGLVQGETRARALCAQLEGRGVDCMVVRAGG